MGVVAAGWYGRKAYKNAMERHAITEAAILGEEGCPQRVLVPATRASDQIR